ncbi:WD G-beta repeat-containing protein protein, putative [Babesia ovis]|uniref:methylated diphthine methylhydrolase n=1 Tax=Babesia ovis TaxID=5869 RepID=A0A9W5TDV2_BABOV|nr:WD G-beta repeat-containing protein protein, putative [Babesia ovis]
MQVIEPARVLYTVDIDGQPDYLSVFPCDEYQDKTLEGAMLAATYGFDPVTKERTGGIFLFNPYDTLEMLMAEEVDPEGSSFDVPLFQIPLPGVLSCSWIRTEDCYAAASLTSHLDINIAQVGTDEDDDLALLPRDEIHLDNDTNGVGLSLNVHDALFSVTASDGHVYVVENGMQKEKWRAHNIEAWISAFHPDNPNVVLTGGDDSTVKVFDRRNGSKPTDTLRHNTYGVTAIKFMEGDPNVFYTGSFDQQLMQLDMRNLSTPLSKKSIEGAVWYIDYVDRSRIHIAGCYDGAYIYETDSEGVPTQLVKQFAKDEALVYGAAHLSLPSGTAYASCSFYTKKIMFWC